MLAKQIIFIGRVQGVGFRYAAHKIAVQYKIVGYVKNLSDNTVEMFVQGSALQVESCIAAIEDYFADYIRNRRCLDVSMHPRYTDFKITY